MMDSCQLFDATAARKRLSDDFPRIIYITLAYEKYLVLGTAIRSRCHVVNKGGARESQCYLEQFNRPTLRRRVN